MAKISFTKLGLTKNNSVATFTWNDQVVEVKQYLPIQEKLELISNVLNYCQDENNFINEGKMAMYMDLEIAYHYTNINFTEKQKADPAKLYDLLASTGFLTELYTVIPPTEQKSIIVWLDKTANHIYDYRNSIYGILDALNTDYSNLELDAESLKQKMADPESLGLVRQILTKLG